MAPPVILAAPHRLPFFIGTANLLALAAWWLLHLIEQASGLAILPAGAVPAGWLHGPAMVQLIFPPFVFGFLLTVFPRWMGYPDLTAATFGPVGVLLGCAAVVAQLGLWWLQPTVLAAGLGLETAAWIFALTVLFGVAQRNDADGKPRCGHAWSALLALSLGAVGCGLTAFAIGSVDTALSGAATQVSITGFLAGIFLTVAHRMVPFFAGNVVAGYVRWRPDWLLGAIWGLLLASLLGEWLSLHGLVTSSQFGLALVCLALLWKWWPRAAAPGLLMVLFWALAWTPLAFALRGLAPQFPALTRAADHALLIGFCATMLVAMVTRVTHGHSGRPLEMSKVAWIAFYGIQFTALLRIIAALRFEPAPLLVVTATVFFLSLVPWCLTNLATYSRVRRDGKSG